MAVTLRRRLRYLLTLRRGDPLPLRVRRRRPATTLDHVFRDAPIIVGTLELYGAVQYDVVLINEETNPPVAVLRKAQVGADTSFMRGIACGGKKTGFALILNAGARRARVSAVKGLDRDGQVDGLKQPSIIGSTTVRASCYPGSRCMWALEWCAGLRVPR
jgi:hypothetical protein